MPGTCLQLLPFPAYNLSPVKSPDLLPGWLAYRKCRPDDPVGAAKENAALNGLDNCKFIAGDVLKVLDEIEEKPDYIILDPPRDGIHPKAIGKIIEYGVENMVYISCKPTSLARDLQIFMDRGYRVEKICCVDMFPNTYHIETIVALHRTDL